MPDPDELDDDAVTAAVLAGALGPVRVAIPARVVTYNAAKQTISAQVVIRSRRVTDALTGAAITYLPPIIPNIPVQFPSGGGCSITWPLVPGNPVLLVMADRSIDEWKTTGQADNTPMDIRRFDLTDAYALPGGRAPVDALGNTAVAADALVIVPPAGGFVRIGSSTTITPLSRADKTDAQLAALAAALTSWTPVPGDGGLALKVLLTALISGGWPATTAATKVFGD